VAGFTLDLGLLATVPEHIAVSRGRPLERNSAVNRFSGACSCVREMIKDCAWIVFGTRRESLPRHASSRGIKADCPPNSLWLRSGRRAASRIGALFLSSSMAFWQPPGSPASVVRLEEAAPAPRMGDSGPARDHPRSGEPAESIPFRGTDAGRHRRCRRSPLLMVTSPHGTSSDCYGLSRRP
jgi:hypothetical protein